jgi:hypothetical protein
VKRKKDLSRKALEKEALFWKGLKKNASGGPRALMPEVKQLKKLKPAGQAACSPLERQGEIRGEMRRMREVGPVQGLQGDSLRTHGFQRGPRIFLRRTPNVLHILEAGQASSTDSFRQNIPEYI